MVKAIAIYLPQFHRVAENDKWWGEGYTEWTAVKRAEPLFQGHYQPHVPLHKNYYDLLNKDTMAWQAQLMKKYNVYGMCFYHYYFENGRKILEKPAENLLQWTDIDMPFCFSWANQTWARSWSKLMRVNVWNSKEEIRSSDRGDGILLKQAYGEEKDWEKHFQYLLPFFRDSRYIRIDNKPVFIIYRPDEISCLPQMMEKWNMLAREQGLEGIYVIAVDSDNQDADAYLCQSMQYPEKDRDKLWDYEIMCNQTVENAIRLNKNSYLCAYTGYDDTPRRGEAGIIVNNSSPDKFYHLLRKLCYLSEKRAREFVFINAWNEWGEGMHLEPDEKYGYGYLEAVSHALNDYQELNEKDMQMGTYEVTDKEAPISVRRNAAFVRLFDKWLRLKEQNKTILPYFEDKGYKAIAIYGIGMVGKHLLVELENMNIKVGYGIDRQGKQLNYPFPVYRMCEKLPQTDVVVVTVTYDFDKIYRALRKKYEGPIVSLEEILDWVENTWL